MTTRRITDPIEKHQPRPGRRSRSRRGGVYPLVLIVSAAAGTAALTGLMMRQAADARATTTTDLIDTRLIARSGIEAVLGTLDERGNWRNAVKNSPNFDYTIDPGSVRVTVSDELDGDLADDGDDPYTLTAVATVGDATATLRVTVESQSEDFREKALAQDPVAYWPFDEDSATVTAAALVGGRNAGYTLNTIPKQRTGFDGRDAPFMNYTWTFAFIPHFSALQLGEGTLMCWFSVESDTGNRQTIVAKDQSSDDGDGELRIFLDGRKVEVEFEHPFFGESAFDTGDISYNRWHHIAITWGSGGFNVYLDGDLEDGNPFNWNDLEGNTLNMTAGAWFDGSSTRDPLNGSVRDLIVYDKALSESEIAAMIADSSFTIIDPESWAWVVD